MNVYGWRLSLSFALGLHASVALAQELVIPDTLELQSMSIGEYEAYREQIRNRMEGASPEHDATPGPAEPKSEHAGKRGTRSGYGQGYGTRNGQGGMQGRQSGFGRNRGGGRRR